MFVLMFDGFQKWWLVLFLLPTVKFPDMPDFSYDLCPNETEYIVHALGKTFSLLKKFLSQKPKYRN